MELHVEPSLNVAGHRDTWDVVTRRSNRPRRLDLRFALAESIRVPFRFFFGRLVVVNHCTDDAVEPVVLPALGVFPNLDITPPGFGRAVFNKQMLKE